MKLLAFIIILLTTPHLLKANPDSTRVMATAKVDGVTYKVIINVGKSMSLVDSNGKLVVDFKNEDLDVDFDAVAEVEFVDFNKDGYKDIMIGYYTNVPDIMDLLLYDKTSKTFKKVENFPNYPASIKLPGKNLYYSYHRSGCADMDWDSDLFKIVNYKIIHIGNISGRECGRRPKQEGLFVYKVKGKREQLVQRFPIRELSNYENKWNFIDLYWKRNYHKFIQ